MKKNWTHKTIKVGFERFRKEQGHIPTAHEIDRTPYLPSSRFIQKRFNGLVSLRAELGYKEANFGKNTHRRAIAKVSRKRSRQLTNDLELLLQKHFAKSSIEKEKTFSGRHRVNFYINTPSGNFGIDIFYAETIRTMQGSMNIKMKKYQYFTDPLYLTVANKTFKQTNLNRYIENKRNPLPNNVFLVTLPTLHKYLRKMNTNTLPADRRTHDIHKKSPTKQVHDIK